MGLVKQAWEYIFENVTFMNFVVKTHLYSTASIIINLPYIVSIIFLFIKVKAINYYRRDTVKVIYLYTLICNLFEIQ